MKRYFIVKNETLVKQLKDFEIMKNKVDDTFKVFVEEYGIEATEYYQFTDQLRICPTENDIQKFKEQLKADKETFKKNSAISKAWVELCEVNKLNTPRKPVWELRDLICCGVYRFRSSLFSLNDEVYGTFEADSDFNLPEEHFVELKASEFYKIVEDAQGKDGE